MSSNYGGLILWPAKGLIIVGFFLLAIQAVSEIIKRDRGDATADPRSLRYARSDASDRVAADDRFHHRQYGAPDVRFAGGRAAARLPGRLRARLQRPRLGPRRHRVRPLPADLLPGAARPHLRRNEQRDAARHSLLHLHGPDPRTIGHGGGTARHHRPALRSGARRSGACRHRRRRPARRDHGRGRRLGHRHGADLAADHDALRLRPAAGDRRHRGFRNAGADHPAEPGAHRHGRPARQVGRRHVLRRDRAGARPLRPLCRLCHWRDSIFPKRRTGTAEGIPHL